jgi:hypothetical protein
MIPTKSKKMSKKLIGRDADLHNLLGLKIANLAQLVVCKGRWRKGKSHLLRFAGAQWPHFIEIQGLAPCAGATNQDQIDNFVNQFWNQSGYPKTKETLFFKTKIFR